MKKISLLLLLLITSNLFSMEQDVGASSENIIKIQAAFKQNISETKKIFIEPMAGGLSQDRKKFKCLLDGKTYVAIILNAFFEQRKKEVSAHLLASEINRAPKIYYYNDEYTLIIMEFISGRTILLEEGSSLKIIDQVSETCRKISQIRTPFLKKDLFSKIYLWCNQIIDKKIELSETFKIIIEKIKILEQKIDKEKRAIVFCHGDLNPRNMFFNKEQLLLIDWEEAGASYEFFDLATFSVFLCLDDSADQYLLRSYCQTEPTEKDLRYFKWLKLIVRISDTLYILVSLDDLTKYSHIKLESIKDFLYYETIFANDTPNDSPEFLYETAISELQLFLKTIDQI